MTPRAAGLMPAFLTTFLSIGTIAIVLMTHGVVVPGQFGTRGAGIVMAAAFAGVGALVTSRRPRHPIGWLFSVAGMLAGLNAFLIEWAAVSIVLAPGWQVPTLLVWMVAWLWVPLVGIALVAIPLVYPTGTLPSPRWRPIAGIAVGSIVVAAIASAIVPGPIRGAQAFTNPFGVPVSPEDAVTMLGILLLPMGAAIAAAGGSLLVRFRHAPRDVRQQIKWLALAALIAVPSFPAIAVLETLSVADGADVVLETLFMLVIAAIGLSAGLAVVRYRLFDIDRIISRTLSYAAVTIILAGVFVAIVLVLQAALSSVTQGDTLAVAASTLVAFALFQPLRRRVQDAVDRRFNRARVDAQRAIDAFGAHVRDDVDLTALRHRLIASARAAVEPDRSGIWLRREERA